MSLPEVFERVQYKVVVGLERWQHSYDRLARADRLRASLRTDLQGPHWAASLLDARRSSSARFLPSVYQRDAMRELFDRQYTAEAASARREALRARQRVFEFFGEEFRYGPEIDWQADPRSGRRWPSGFHADVPVHRGDIGCGDVKYVWELSRQQYLIDLAKAHFLWSDEQDLREMCALVRSWIDGNPYGTGVNWSCALEPAFRALSWLWAYHLTVDALDDDFHVTWLRAIHDHGRFIARHLERYSSPYNHLIGEATALYAIASCFPEFRDSARWRRDALTVLVTRLHEQFYADGGSVEQSTFYHHATVGFYLLAALIARANGDELPPAIWAAVERGIEFSMRLMQPDGRTPEIGGADDGKPIRMENLPFWDFRPYQAIGAVLFRRGDFKAAAGRFYEDALWLLGTDGLEAFDRLESDRTPPASSALPQSGYFVLRGGDRSAGDYVCFDCGEQAAGMRPDAVPNSMHGHADCLSVIVTLGGRRVLVDSGLFAYNCGGAWEAHFRETAAHNTVRVDGRDQARHIGKMAWSHSYRATQEGWWSGNGEAWAFGTHDGYARGDNGVVHRRAVWLRPGGYVAIFDEVSGRGEHEVELNFQFAPGTLEIAERDREQAQAHYGAVLFDGAVDVVWTATGPIAVDTREGGPHPEDGWIASSLGVRRAAPRMMFTTRMKDRLVVLTILARRSSRECRVSRVPLRSDGSLLAIRDGDATDYVAASGLARTDILSTDGYLAVCRLEGGVIRSSQHLGGTSVSTNPAAFLTLTPPSVSR
jgi:hypothetical protein